VVKLDYDLGIADLQAVKYKLPRGVVLCNQRRTRAIFPSHTGCMAADHQNIKYHQASGMVKQKGSPALVLELSTFS